MENILNDQEHRTYWTRDGYEQGDRGRRMEEWGFRGRIDEEFGAWTIRNNTRNNNRRRGIGSVRLKRLRS